MSTLRSTIAMSPFANRPLNGGLEATSWRYRLLGIRAEDAMNGHIALIQMVDPPPGVVDMRWIDACNLPISVGEAETFGMYGGHPPEGGPRPEFEVTVRRVTPLPEEGT